MLTASTPEARLLFSLVQASGDSSPVDEIVDGTLDWNRVLWLARRHRLTSQLYRTVRDSGYPVPDNVVETLRRLHRSNSLNNLQSARWLHELSASFAENGIRAVPYKGPVLAQYLYGDIAQRWFTDLDFLVPEPDILRARELLLNCGYEQTNYSDTKPETLIDSSVFRWGKEFRFAAEGDQSLVELRFGFIGGNRSDSAILKEIWERQDPIPVAGKSVTALCSVDRALLLLVHGTKHGWRRLGWVQDIRALLEREIQWKKVLSRAERYGWQNAVLFGLAVVSEFTETPLPGCIRSALKGQYRHTLAASSLASLLSRDPSEGLRRIEPLMTVLFLNDSPSDAASELVDVLVSPRKIDYEYLSLPRDWYQLYYLVRPYRIGRELVSDLFSQGTRRGEGNQE